MLLQELLSLIGFTKFQQICLIKILFLTGALGFVKPDTSSLNVDNIITVQNQIISSNLNPQIISSSNTESISLETAELILDNAKFISKEKAYNWLDNVMQENFHRGNIERHEIKDKFKNFAQLNNLIQKFDLIGEIKQEGKFDYTIVTGCSEKCIKNKTLFLSRFLIENKVKSNQIYFIGSERPGYPYLESSVELILAQSLAEVNNLSFKENLYNVKKTFIKVANQHLLPLANHEHSKLGGIRKIFKDHPEFFNIQLLLDKLKAEPIFANIKWPSETDIIIHTCSKTLKKYHIKIIETSNKKIGSNIIRSNTKDSAKAWIKDTENIDFDPTKPPKILLVSNQPKAKYQFNVFRSILGNKYDISLAASSCYGKQNLSLLLSEIASIIHEAKGFLF